MNLLSALLACAVCMGGSDSKIGPAINGAIFAMIGCIGLMLSLIAGVAYSFVRRARAFAATQSLPGQNLSFE